MKRINEVCIECLKESCNYLRGVILMIIKFFKVVEIVENYKCFV